MNPEYNLNNKPPKKRGHKALWTIFILALLGGGGYLAYPHIQSMTNKTPSSQLKISLAERKKINKMVMRTTAEAKQDNFKKQGFIAIPDKKILVPIYNDAYTRAGLDVGAGYANKDGKPTMGKGNYGLAAHAFQFGKYGFSDLQSDFGVDAPYLVDGKKQKGIKDLAGTKIYMMNKKGVYEYVIKDQDLVDNTNLSVLDKKLRINGHPRLTIISCLWPSIDYRIITKAELKQTYTLENTPDKIIKMFDLRKQNTFYRTSYFNPGTEEGANGDAGGAK